MSGGIEGAYELTAEATDGEDVRESHAGDLVGGAPGGAGASSADPIPDPPIGGVSIGVIVEGEAADSEGGVGSSPGPVGILAKGADASGPV